MFMHLCSRNIVEVWCAKGMFKEKYVWYYELKSIQNPFKIARFDLKRVKLILKFPVKNNLGSLLEENFTLQIKKKKKEIHTSVRRVEKSREESFESSNRWRCSKYRLILGGWKLERKQQVQGGRE